MKPAAILLALALATAGASSPALAHPGGLAADGCHKEKASGTRHCHPERAAPPPRSAPRPVAANVAPNVASFAAPLSAPKSPVTTSPSGLTQSTEEEIAALAWRLTAEDRAAVLQLMRSLAR